MVSKVKNIQFDFCDIIFHKVGIVELKFDDNLLMDEIKGKLISDALFSQLGSQKVPILHYIGKFMNATKEGREYSVSDEGMRNAVAYGFVIHSLAHKIIANFYLKMDKPEVPTKFFGTRQEAIVWLKTFL